MFKSLKEVESLRNGKPDQAETRERRCTASMFKDRHTAREPETCPIEAGLCANSCSPVVLQQFRLELPFQNANAATPQLCSRVQGKNIPTPLLQRPNTPPLYPKYLEGQLLTSDTN